MLKISNMEYDAKTVDALKELMRIMQEHCVVSEADMLRIARNDRAYALQLIAECRKWVWLHHAVKSQTNWNYIRRIT